MKLNYLKKIATVVSLLAVSGVSVAKDPLKVGFLYGSPVGDYGWAYQHDVAKQKAEKKFGDAVSIDSVMSNRKDVKSVIENMANNQYDMIISTTDDFKKAMLNASKTHPTVKFLSHMSDFETKNLAGYSVRNGGFYLAGIASAKLAKSKVIGAVGLMHFPSIYGNINAFALGAQSVDPEIKIKVIWLSTFDPEAAVEAVREMKGTGVDTILQQAGDQTFVAAAEEEGMWVVGYNGVAKKYAPTKYVTSVINNWSGYYQRQIDSALNEKWKSKNTWADFNQGMVTMTALNPAVPKETQSQVRKIRSKMVSGQFDMFTGPLEYADGSIFVKDRKKARYYDIIRMKKFVKGVEDITK